MAFKRIYTILFTLLLLLIWNTKQSLSSPSTHYTCALNPPCPPPKWPPTYNLTLSTIVQPGGPNYFLPPIDKPWGFIELDWSVGSNYWKNATDQNESTVEATSIYGCKQIKKSFPNTRCMIYHNMELALQAFESQRKVMYDPRYSDWFLQYTDGKGNKNGTIYNEPGGPGDQYFWDFRNIDCANYYITSVISTVNYPYVDGSFTDDVAGLPEEHSNAPKNMHLSSEEVADIQKATQQTNQRLIDALIDAGKYNWQAFGHQDTVGPGISKSQCSNFMNNYCKMQNSNSNNYTMTMAFDANNAIQSLAAFLIVRPLYAWLGFGWESDMKNWNDVFLYDVGLPKGNCNQVSNGVYQRLWSYGNVTIDCSSWTAVVPHQ
eukprot:524569_1